MKFGSKIDYTYLFTDYVANTLQDWKINILLEDLYAVVRFSPIPFKYLHFHEKLKSMGVYEKINKYRHIVTVNYTNLDETFIPSLAFHAFCQNKELAEAMKLGQYGDLDADLYYDGLGSAMCNQDIWFGMFCNEQYKKITGSYIHEIDTIWIESLLEDSLMEYNFEASKWLYDLLPSKKYKKAILKEFEEYDCNFNMKQIVKDFKEFMNNSYI